MRTAALALLIAPALAQACINDRDTLAFEMRNVDAIRQIKQQADRAKRGLAVEELALRAIGGRFERYPAPYYEMRIQRIGARPKDAAEADDLAVAHDRLGRIDDAIRILLATKPLRKSEDDWYRLHANYGTFLVHRWVAGGAKKEDYATLDQSIRQIEKAIQIRPDSHFGREAVQLELEKAWRRQEEWPRRGSMTYEDLVVGASGIAMMGLGYELPDVYALIGSYGVAGQASVSSRIAFAGHRYAELEAQGKLPVSIRKSSPNPDNSMLSDYRRLRADGQRVHEARTAYMLARLNRGEHPDTHPGFWSEWREPAFPTLRRESRQAREVLSNPFALLAAASIAAICLVVALRLVARAVHARGG